MNESAFPRWLMAALGLAALALLAGGVWFYRAQERALRHEAEAELTAIAQLKVDQITQWRAEQLADAAALASSPFFDEAVARWLVAPRAGDTDQILTRFHSLQAYHHYRDVLLVDASGQVHLSLSGSAGRLHEEAAQALAAALAAGQPTLSDLHAGPGALPPHIDAIAPLSASNSPTSEPVGAVVLQNDARQFLYPLIQSWPVPSDSAETLLVRRDGDQVLFLNDLRFQPGAAFTLHFPLSQTDLPAVMAVLGQEGLVRGVDYRGVEVLSVLKAVPDSPWFIEAKVDAAEALSAARRESTLILALLVGLVLAAAVGAAAIWQRNATAHYHALYEAETARRKAEQHHRITLMSVGDGVIVADADGRVELLNPVAEALTGWLQAEACGRPLAEVFRIVNEETHQPVKDPVRRVLREGQVVGLANHTLLIARDGTERPIADSGAPIRSEQGEIGGVVLVFRDQTAEREARRALQDSEDKFKYVFEAANAGKSLTLPSGEVNVNKAFADLLGYSWEELKNKRWQDLTPADDVELSQRMIDSLLKGERDSTRFEKRYLHKNGFLVWADVSSTLRRDGEGQPLYFVTTIVDVTERKRAEEALQESEENFRTLADNASDGIMIAMGEGTHVYANRRMAEITGYSASELLKIDLVGLVHPDDLQKVRERFQKRLTEKTAPRQYEFAIVRKDGESVPIEITAAKTLWQGQPADIVVFRDITERKRAEDALRESGEKYRAVADFTYDWEYWLGPDGQYIYVSPSCERITGYRAKEFLQDPALLERIVHPDDRALVTEHLKQGVLHDSDHTFDFRIVARGGEERWIGHCCQPVYGHQGQYLGQRGSHRDITERKRAEEALRENEKLLREIAANYPNSYLSIIEDDLTVGFTSGQEFKKQGLDPNSFVGLTLEQVFGEHTPFVREHYLKAFDGVETEFELFFNGQHQFYRVVPLVDDGGRVERIMAVVENVTERKRAEETLRQRASQLALLNEIGGQVAALLNVDQVLDRAAHLVQERFGYHHVGLFIKADGQDRLVMRARAGKFASLYPPGHSLALGRGMVGWAGQHGKTLLANDVDAEPHYVNPYPDRLPTRSELSVPICIGAAESEIVGVLDVQSPQSNAFGPDDVTTLETLAGELAVAIHNARLYSQAARHNRELALLNRVIAEATSTLDVEQVLRVACQELAQAFDLPQAAAALLNAGGTDLTVVVEYLEPGHPSSLGRAIPVAGNAAPEYVIAHGTALVVSDAQSDERMALIHDLIRERGTVSLLIVPLMVRGRVAGTIGLAAVERREFTKAEIALAQNVAAAAGQALETARLYQALRRDADDLKRVVAERTAELKVALEQARGADRLKSTFVSNVSHELRTPLTNLKLYLTLLTRGVAEKHEVYLATLHREVDRLQVLIEGLLDLSRLDLGKTQANLAPTDLNQLVSILVTDRSALAADRGLALNVVTERSLSPALADAKLIEQVVTNLLTNAINYTPSGGVITLRTAGAETDGQAWSTISVADTGPGISGEEQTHLFERFYRGQAAQDSNAPGTGLGLAICKEIVDRHEGRIAVESQLGRGSTFTVWLKTAAR